MKKLVGNKPQRSPDHPLLILRNYSPPGTKTPAAKTSGRGTYAPCRIGNVTDPACRVGDVADTAGRISNLTHTTRRIRDVSDPTGGIGDVTHATSGIDEDRGLDRCRVAQAPERIDLHPQRRFLVKRLPRCQLLDASQQPGTFV